jgi:hypothetical protein
MRQLFNLSNVNLKRENLLLGSENRSHVNASFERRETAWNLFYLNFFTGNILAAIFSPQIS